MSSLFDENGGPGDPSMMTTKGKMSKRMMKAYNIEQFASLKSQSAMPPTISLVPLNGTFSLKKIDLFESLKIGRQVSPKQPPASDNGIFDSKVLSRQHAEISFQDGKVMFKDVGSSNGSFVGGRKCEPEVPVELKNGDLIEFGVDMMNEEDTAVLYRKIAATLLISGPGFEQQAAPEMNSVETATTPASAKDPGSNPAVDAAFSLIQEELKTAADRAVELDKLSKALTEVEQSVDTKLQPVDTNNKEFEDKIAELESLVSRLRTSEKELKSSNEVLKKSLADSNASHSEALAAITKKSESEKAMIESDLTAARKALAEKEQQVSTLDKNLVVAEKSLKDVNERAASLLSEIETLHSNLKAVKSDSREELSSLEQSLEEQLKAKDDAYAKITQELNAKIAENGKKALEDIEAVEGEKKELQARIATLESELASRKRKDPKDHKDTMTSQQVATSQHTMTEKVTSAEVETMSEPPVKTLPVALKENRGQFSLIQVIIITLVAVLASQAHNLMKFFA